MEKETKDVEIRQKKVVISLTHPIAVPLDSENIVMTTAFIAEINTRKEDNNYDRMPMFARIVGFPDGRSFKKSRMVTFSSMTVAAVVDYEEA